jgi:hypothetical protein
MTIDLNQLLSVVSLLVGLLSLVVSGYAIHYAKTTESDTRKNFDATRQLLGEQTDRVKQLLAEVDKKTEVITKTVNVAQDKLLDMTIRIVEEGVIHNEQNQRRQLDAQLLELVSRQSDRKRDDEDAKPIIPPDRSRSR